MSEVPRHVLDWRRRTGEDQFDEMWEGVLHMTPCPNREHQELEWALETWLRQHWAKPRGNKVFHQINVAAIGGWPKNYRIPDLVLLTPDRFHIDRNEYFEGPPTVVVEIRTPDDETLEKCPFYATLGVPEVWVIDRDTREPRVFTLSGDGYEALAPAADGWITSGPTGIQLRGVSPARLAIQIAGAGHTCEQLPDASTY
jgi:Uma2 family endonuclease